MIIIKELMKSYGPNTILDNINLTIAQSEVTALIGPSGGGKSTLLRCMNGLETFQSGEIQIADITIIGGRTPSTTTLLTLRRKIGMVFQQFHLFPHLSALENVMCGPQYALGKTAAEAETIARPLLDRVGLAEKAEAKPGQLSGGQQQRVAIARSLAVQPSAILFDEPTSALDPTMANEVLAVFKQLATEGQTMIVVTHDMAMANQAHVIHKMQAGQIIQSGPPERFLP